MIKTGQKKKSAALIFLLLAVIIILGFGMRFVYMRLYRAAYPVHYLEAVMAQSMRRDLDPALVFAVILCESSFNELAISNVEARGLMQITEDTFEWARWRMTEDEGTSFDAMFDPETNIRYGTAILRILMNEFGSERVALAAYHAGWGSVKGWLEDERYSTDGESLYDIPFPTTSSYVDKVLKARETYQKLYDFS